MTPMIDVVFLLIIFFLVSSHLARQENRLPLDLPVTTTFNNVNPERAPLTISIDDQGEWRVGGDKVDLDQLKQALQDHRAKAGRTASLRIRSQGDIPYRYVEPVLKEAAKSGILDTSIAVQQPES